MKKVEWIKRDDGKEKSYLMLNADGLFYICEILNVVTDEGLADLLYKEYIDIDKE